MLTESEWKHYRESLPVCKECGNTERHYAAGNGCDKSCSRYRHWGDDHYDSDCMLGYCDECNKNRLLGE